MNSGKHPLLTGPSLGGLLLGGLLLGGLALGACEKETDPCSRVQSFADVFGPQCPEATTYASQCATQLATLTSPALQDFDWCVDCLRLRVVDATNYADLDCSSAPLNGRDCGLIVDETIGATCFAP